MTRLVEFTSPSIPVWRMYAFVALIAVNLSNLVIPSLRK